MNNPINKQASQSIMNQLGVLSKIATDQQYAQQPDVWKPYKEAGYKKSIRDAGFHLSYLAESLAANDSSLFLDYIAWAKVLFVGLKLPQGALRGALECMNQALQKTLRPELAGLSQNYIAAALEHLSSSPETLTSFINPNSLLFDLATNYLNALLKDDRRLASKLILEAVSHNISVKDIYLHVFQPCQQEIGRLWQMNKISVAQEHFCTVVTQMVMSQLYPYIFSTEKTGRSMVATAVGGELHEIGIRMVSDFMEMEGWDTYFLGANTPTDSILQAIDKRNADILTISATLTLHVSKVEELIDNIRSSSSHPAIKILVGGYPFNIARNLWKEIGADGYASNAQGAVIEANRIVANSS